MSLKYIKLSNKEKIEKVKKALSLVGLYECKKKTEVVFYLLRDINKGGKIVVIVTHNKKIANRCDIIINI